jgi:hypothetical protein
MAGSHADRVRRPRGRPGSWHVIWYEHTGIHDPPDVDFRRELIVVVFGGTRPAGDSLEIISVTREGSSVVVRYREQRCT